MTSEGEEGVFERYAEKLERNVYGSVKGEIRLRLLLRDIEEFLPAFSAEKSLNILDIGGGQGHFAELCLQRGHHVVLCDNSSEMLAGARERLSSSLQGGKLTLVQHDFLSLNLLHFQRFDLVLMHGSAEWMSDSAGAISRACRFVKTGGALSLLVFNKDKFLFKRGINGLLESGDMPRKSNKLIPPGAMSVAETRELLHREGAKILLQSGVRIFYQFFRSIDESILSSQQWLEQELAVYRRPPFSLMGEHSHFLCRLPGVVSELE